MLHYILFIQSCLWFCSLRLRLRRFNSWELSNIFSSGNQEYISKIFSGFFQAKINATFFYRIEFEWDQQKGIQASVIKRKQQIKCSDSVRSKFD